MLPVSIESKACIITTDFLSDPGSKINCSHPSIQSIAYHLIYCNLDCGLLMIGLDLIWVRIVRVVEGVDQDLHHFHLRRSRVLLERVFPRTAQERV